MAFSGFAIQGNTISGGFNISFSYVILIYHLLHLGNAGNISYTIHINPLGGGGFGQAGHGHDVPAQDDHEPGARADLA